MWRKIAAGFALILLALLVTVLAAWWLPVAEPPLRVGMTEEEVSRVLDPPVNPLQICDVSIFEDVRGYSTKADWLGRRRHVCVWFTDQSLVERWEVESPPPSRLPWLDRAMKWAGR